jgi:hypothetical protein
MMEAKWQKLQHIDKYNNLRKRNWLNGWPKIIIIIFENKIKMRKSWIKYNFNDVSFNDPFISPLLDEISAFWIENKNVFLL